MTEDKWISVKDRPLRSGEHILCIDKNNPIYSRMLIWVNNINKSIIGNTLSASSLGQITHYVLIDNLLPKPPEGE